VSQGPLSSPVRFDRYEVDLLQELLADALSQLPAPGRWTRLNSLRTMFAELSYDRVQTGD
jgi:hypothetical protein